MDNVERLGTLLAETSWTGKAILPADLYEKARRTLERYITDEAEREMFLSMLGLD
jgi:hypothetical protein